ncbi:hypothetical protein ACFOSC_02525 [Streptantibioticus rubrisoli]|uniref:HAAS signaling domain-containing protein n=1 Tax=Streptantibioticus rubrisoli TaxID=1387313 RepID=UPI003558C345
MPNQLIEDYLHRLDNASAFLTRHRRAELREEIRDHISAALKEAATWDEDTVRAVLERLGPPAEIAAAETGSPSTGAGPVVTPIGLSVAGPHTDSSATDTAHDLTAHPEITHTLVVSSGKRFGKKTLYGAGIVGLLTGLAVMGACSTSGQVHNTPIPSPPTSNSTRPPHSGQP